MLSEWLNIFGPTDKCKYGLVYHSSGHCAAGSVYIAYSVPTGLYKIGCTGASKAQVRHRISTLNKKYNDSLRLVYAIETDCKYGLEKEMHRLFETKRVFGEFFALSESDILGAKQIVGLEK